MGNTLYESLTKSIQPIAVLWLISSFGWRIIKEMTEMNKPMSSFGFKLMSLMFKVRDFLRPRIDILKEAGIESGFSVLDFGCGPGGYIVPLAELVGRSGKINALDVHPLAIRVVKRIATRKGIKNIATVESDCSTGLPDNSVDVVLLYDVFHDLARPDDVLRELHRILKPGGRLSFSGHHMKQVEVLTRVTGAGMFRFIRKGKKTYSFAKID
jgi:ubiquinone/menaquinone biosynthesis C-methylase UbiE